MQRVLMLMLIVALGAGCPVRGGSGGRGGGGSDDDDSAADDDDATSNDDDATSNDDDATSNDDDATANDDDATGDDDDDDDDDDDGAGTPWINDVFCLDWGSVNWISPSATTIATMQGFGVDLTTVPLLLSPTAVSGGSIDLRLAAASSTTCTQDISVPTADQTGSWSDPTFDFGPANFTLPLTTGSVALYNTEVGGDINSGGTQITNSTVTGSVELPSAASFACGLVLTCVPCPIGGGDCIDLDLNGATWNNVGAGPLVLVP